MATPPTLRAEFGSSNWINTTWPKSVSVTTVVGDRLVCAAMHAEYVTASNAFQTPAGGTGLVWTQVAQINVVNYAVAAVWTATAVTAETFNLSVATVGASVRMGGVDVLAFSAATSDGFGASASANVDATAPSLAVTPTRDNSTLVYWSADWNVLDGTSRAWRTINGFTPTPGGTGEFLYSRGAGNVTVYGARYSDAGLAGSPVTVGLTAPTGQRTSGIVLEVLGLGPVTVALTPAPFAFSAPAVSPVPQPVTVTLSPAVVALTAPAVSPVSQAVTVALTPAVLTPAAVSLSPVPRAVAVALTPAVLLLTAVVLQMSGRSMAYRPNTGTVTRPDTGLVVRP